MKKNKGIIIITGIDTGIGLSLARRLAMSDYHIIATYLKSNPLAGHKNIHGYKVDFRDPEALDRFCKKTSWQCSSHRITAVIANAGVGGGGPIENLPLEVYREYFEVNYFSVVKLVQTFIPHLIRSKGRFIIIGSTAGKVAAPFFSAYASSKHAIEGFCDSLRREMRLFGVKTVLIEPAAVATPIWNNGRKQDISFIDKKYYDCFCRGREMFIEGGNLGKSPDSVAASIHRILVAKHPRTRYVVGKNPLLSKLIFKIPNFMLDRLIEKKFDMRC